MKACSVNDTWVGARLLLLVFILAVAFPTIFAAPFQSSAGIDAPGQQPAEKEKQSTPEDMKKNTGIGTKTTATDDKTEAETHPAGGTESFYSGEDAGQVNGTKKKTVSEFSMENSFSFIQGLMALSFVLGLIFLAAYLYKKVMGISTPGLRRNRVPIDVVGNMALGEKKYLSVVEIQGKHYFIGITPGSINLLSELQLELPALEKNDNTGGHDFGSILRKAGTLLNKGKK
ncbi:MAG: flagellar biosynthetic protein FliO [bacterium]|nr:flagellar biosynthetic protein FliO [bacterium]